MKFATRLYVGFGFIVTVMAILLALNINLSSQQNKELTELVDDRYEKIKLLTSVRLNTFYIYNQESGLGLYTPDENLTDSQRLVKINNDLDTLRNIASTEQEKEDVVALASATNVYEAMVGEIYFSRNRNQPELEAKLLDDLEQKYNEISLLAIDMINKQENIMEGIIEEAENRFNVVVGIGIGSVALGIVIGIALSFWSIRTITKRLSKLKVVMNSVEYGSEQLPRITVLKQDEIGEIATAYNQMATSLESHEKSGRIYKEDIEAQNWLKTCLAELAILTQEIHDIKTLGQQYIQAIVPMVDSSYGVIYVKEVDGEQPYLLKLASYAENAARERIEVGEGLAGQCLLDGKPIKLTKIPANYVEISSGLGKTGPKNMLIMPIHLNGEMLAVLEIASIHEFTVQHEELLQQATEQLSIMMNRIQKQMQVRVLLEETQVLNEELQSQSEELQLQQEELRAMNEELEAQNKQAEKRTNDLQDTKNALEEKTRQVLLSSQYKSEFMANMSHELRTPLNSLLILAQILEENKEQNLTEKQIEYATTIHSSGKDLLELINEILDLSKIESGKMDAQIGEIDIRGVVSFAENQFNAIAEQKGISFGVKVEDDVPMILYSDEQKIYQILKNLLSNALKFTEKGNVDLKVYRSEFTLQHGGQECIAFSVIDTGIGISKDKQELIFEAFQQADGTTSRKFGGTGLGLSISKGMADLLSGYITVHSNEGEGSIFTFYLPVQPEELMEVAAAKTAEKVSERQSDDHPQSEMLIQDRNFVMKENVLVGKRILLVDDDMRNVFALTTALEVVGIEVCFAENGRESIELLNQLSDVDLILMDIMMPEMDGYEAMKRIRQLPRFEEIPIIALTAKAMKDDREKCIEAGASDYISKPIQLDQLLSLLQVWLYK